MNELREKIRKSVKNELLESKARDLVRVGTATALGAAYGLTVGLAKTGSPVGGAIGAALGGVVANTTSRSIVKNERVVRKKELETLIKKGNEKIAKWRSDKDDPESEEKISNKRVQIMKWQKELSQYD